jgi:hypothetical protein
MKWSSSVPLVSVGLLLVSLPAATAFVCHPTPSSALSAPCPADLAEAPILPVVPGYSLLVLDTPAGPLLAFCRNNPVTSTDPSGERVIVIYSVPGATAEEAKRHFEQVAQWLRDRAKKMLTYFEKRVLPELKKGERWSLYWEGTKIASPEEWRKRLVREIEEPIEVVLAPAETLQTDLDVMRTISARKDLQAWDEVFYFHHGTVLDDGRAPVLAYTKEDKSPAAVREAMKKYPRVRLGACFSNPKRPDAIMVFTPDAPLGIPVTVTDIVGDPPRRKFRVEQRYVEEFEAEAEGTSPAGPWIAYGSARIVAEWQWTEVREGKVSEMSERIQWDK